MTDPAARSEATRRLKELLGGRIGRGLPAMLETGESNEVWTSLGLPFQIGSTVFKDVSRQLGVRRIWSLRTGTFPEYEFLYLAMKQNEGKLNETVVEAFRTKFGKPPGSWTVNRVRTMFNRVESGRKGGNSPKKARTRSSERKPTAETALLEAVRELAAIRRRETELLTKFPNLHEFMEELRSTLSDAETE